MQSTSLQVPSEHDRNGFQHAQVEIIRSGAQRIDPITLADIDIARERQQRPLFYDELVWILIVLHSSLDVGGLSSCLSQSEITLSAQITALSVIQGANTNEHSTVKFVLDTAPIASGEPVVVSDPSGIGSIAIHQVQLHLRHPERQLGRPQVHFAASVLLKPRSTTAVEPREEYLQPGSTSSANLLSPLLAGPEFADTKLWLAASRLEKVYPAQSQEHDDFKPIRSASAVFPIGPALLLQISRTLFSDDAYLKLLLQVPDGSTSTIEVGVVDGQVQGTDCTALGAVSLPSSMLAGDRSSFIFRAGAEQALRPAQFRIMARVQASTGLESQLVIRRQLGTPAHIKLPSKERLKYWIAPKGASRPTSTTIGPREAPEDWSGVKVSITAPRRIRVGEVFKIGFFVLNKSIRKRRLAIIAAPVGTTGGMGTKINNRSSWIVTRSGGPNNLTAPENADIAEAVIDTTQLYLQATGSRPVDDKKAFPGASASGGEAQRYRADTIPIDTDLKLGTLMPGSCHEVSMRIQAINEGLVTIDGIVLCDLDSRETSFIGEGWEGIAYQPEVEVPAQTEGDHPRNDE